ncbi:MAG TPA: gamma-glutamylcyclotransferase family protein [Polyangiaceae bacterium]|nr:gamma-glutamylcyclotransferase family protein [Polyangiaceae bacterium]
MEKDRVRLFVYGTLKRGFVRADLMAGATFERCATTQCGYALHDLGAYPALVTATEGTVIGEVYWVDAEHLDALDRYEGCPELYQRESIVLEDGSRAEAYSMTAARVRGCPRIEGGDFQSRG